MKHIIFALIVTVLIGSLVASCEKDRTDLDLEHEVNILEFKIGDRSGEIDTDNARILVYLPAGTTDLSALEPVVSVSSGATVTPASGEAVDLSDSVEYTVFAGNVYKMYWVRASVRKAEILSFSINGSQGIIDPETNSIEVPLPLGTDLTSLAPEITLSEESTVSPASGVAQDFSNPVTYTVSSGTEIIEYTAYTTVAATPDTTKGAIGSRIAFLGDANDRFSLPDDDEQAAADFFFSEYADADFISWNQVLAGHVNIYDYKVIWWHYDAGWELPSQAAHQAVIDIFSDYMKDGGNLFLSGHACQYFWTIGRFTNAYNMAIGSGDGFENPDTWTIGVNLPGNDQRGHPIYQDLAFDDNNGFFTFPVIGPGWKEDHNHVIVEVAAFHGYPNNAPGAYVAFTEQNNVQWLGVWGGIQDYFMAGIMEMLPTDEFSGRAIYLGIGGIEWNQNAQGDINPTGENPHQGNIETLARNTINYLSAN